MCATHDQTNELGETTAGSGDTPQVHRMAKNEDGAVAVEFGILAIPFFAIVFAIFETSLTFFAQQVLESALQDATRYILTGQSQAQTLDWNQAKFRQAVCSRTFGLFSCSGTDATTDQLWVKVAPITKFSDCSVADRQAGGQ